jgi:hypothetical protein
LGGTGTSLTPAGYALKNVTGLALDDERNLYVLDGADQQLIEIPVNGGAAFLIPQSNFKSPSGLALDNLGNVYVSDSGAASNTVTELVYHNAANFGSVAVGTTSSAITFNYEFYERMAVEATRGIGGGVRNAEYHKAPGGTCVSRTYYPSTSSTGLTLPSSCTVILTFTPDYPGGRPGAVQLQTSNGNETQLVNGIGLGGELALLNSTITTKVASGVLAAVVNAADTEIYYSTEGGTYKIPVGGGVPTLVTTTSAGLFAVNGAGDLFFFSAPLITKIPADGSAPSVINVPGLIAPFAIVMDPNGTFYITDEGAGFPNFGGFFPPGFVVRVSSTGAVSKLPDYWISPSVMTIDGAGNLYILDPYQQILFEIQAGTGSYTQINLNTLYIGGDGGLEPANLMVDASGTLYFWDEISEGLWYDPPFPLQENNATNFPLYTIA